MSPHEILTAANGIALAFSAHYEHHGFRARSFPDGKVWICLYSIPLVEVTEQQAIAWQQESWETPA